MELATGESKRLQELFVTWRQKGLSYVILRKYEQLPERVDGDVDVFVSPEHYERAVELSRRVGFQQRQTEMNRASLLWYALRNPNRVLGRISDGIGQLLSSGTPTAELEAEPISTVSVQKMMYGDVEVELSNHIPYLSDGRSVRFRVSPAVEARMLRRRRLYQGISVPAAPDELMHLLLHCAFDYDGEVPPYYSRRCEMLAKAVFESPLMRTQFEQLATDLFAEDAEHAVQCVEVGAFDELVQSDVFSERRLAWRFNPTTARIPSTE